MKNADKVQQAIRDGADSVLSGTSPSVTAKRLQKTYGLDEGQRMFVLACLEDIQDGQSIEIHSF